MSLLFLSLTYAGRRRPVQVAVSRIQLVQRTTRELSVFWNKLLGCENKTLLLCVFSNDLMVKSWPETVWETKSVSGSTCTYWYRHPISSVRTWLTLDSGWDFIEKESENFELHDLSGYRACAMKCFQILESLVWIPFEGWLKVLDPPCFIILCSTCHAISLPPFKHSYKMNMAGLRSYFEIPTDQMA
jgi:hypothetical protein